MTTLHDLLQERLREQRDGQLDLDAKAAVLREQIKEAGREVIRLIWLDVLEGAELPAGASVTLLNSSIHGHQVQVRFPGRLVITTKHLYMASGVVLVVRHGDLSGGQQWVASDLEANKQKTFDDFIGAAIWLLGVKLDEEQAPVANVTER